MKRISNEIKVGVTTIIVIVIFIWLYSFLKGKDLFSNTASYYSVYDKIGGLAESSPVEINGYKVGVVQSIEFLNAESGKLLVEFTVKKNFRLPVNSVAEIVPMSVLGGMKVQFVFGGGPGYYNDGDTIRGVLAETIMEKVEMELLPARDKITNLIVTIDTVLNTINKVLDSDFKRNLKGTMSNLNTTTESLNRILSSKEADIRTTLESLNKFSKMLANNSANFSETIKNLNSVSDTLAAADIYSAVTNLKVGLERTSVLIKNLNEGKGSAGKFISDDSLYINMNKSLVNMNILLKDLKENPKRYVHFSVFGKKDNQTK
jgi:phospholipid/cholesterol/gamma-HCH transport system substrate-binding protein